MRGYFGIGVSNPKKSVNIGTLWRSASNFGAAFLFTIGLRYQQQPSDPTKADRHIPLFHFADLMDFLNHRPRGCALVGVEQSTLSTPIQRFTHPERAMYLLGAEDEGLSAEIQGLCASVIHIETPRCLNVAVAGSIVMFHRKAVK